MPEAAVLCHAHMSSQRLHHPDPTAVCLCRARTRLDVRIRRIDPVGASSLSAALSTLYSQGETSWTCCHCRTECAAAVPTSSTIGIKPRFVDI